MKVRVGWNIFLFLLIIMAVATAGRGLVPHPPIVIATDKGFTFANGVRMGSGTIDDPYVISGWSISVDRGVGIKVQGTSARFVIRNCAFTGGGTGILLKGVAGVVQSCSFQGLNTGVFLYRSAEAVVRDSTFVGCTRGIEGTEADGIILSNDVVQDTNNRGIFLWRCHKAKIVGNRIKDGEAGIYLDSCHHDRLELNRVEDVDRGIFLWDSFDCSLTGNVIRGCYLGLALVHTSARNTVFHNAFYENACAATCDELDNQWDGGYPIGGNYWSKVEGEDRYSGLDQDEPGTDGIMDSPVVIPFGNLDHYPLMAPPEEIKQKEEER